jgi:DNA-binding NarL/FixJ family response regulator
MFRFLIADDHAIVRKGLVQLLKEEFANALCDEATDGNELLNKARSSEWNVILLDISMPGLSGLETLKQLRIEGIKTPVLMLSMHSEEQYAVRVLKAGASGFLNKESANEELILAVHKLLAGRKYVSPTVAEILANTTADANAKPLHENLSDREMQVLQLMASGKTVSEIAEEISLSVNTISTYRSRILEKLSLHNNAELTRYAIENGLV